MNISYRAKIKGFTRLTALFIFFLSLGFSNNASAADGEALFKTCAACHNPTDEVLIGPGLKGAKKRWADAGIGDKIYEWVQNPAKVLAEGNPYVKDLVGRFSSQALMASQPFNKEEIDAILDYADNYTPPAPPEGTVAADQSASGEKKGGGKMWIIILGVIFVIIAFSAGSVRRQLVNANLEKAGKPELEDLTYFQIWKAWAWRHKVLVTFIALFFVMGGLADGWYRLKDVGVFENYKPEQPIAFSHKVHAGDNKIACQYCHSTVEKSRHATIPSTMVCMNCHKGIKKGTTTGETEIAKIYKSVGFDPTTMSYTGKTEPVQWIKVHNLPDHVYFSHQQHVVAGQLDCKQCHGVMAEETVARVMPHEELNAIEGNVKVTRPTLTMGWCIECHNETAVKMDGNGYYDEMKKRLMKNQKLLKKHLEDDKISVAELGGWECAKCHY